MTALIIFTLYAIFGTILRGWVLSILWGWFIVPLGGPPIGIAHAAGISMLVAFLTHHYTEDPESDKSAAERTIAVCVRGVLFSFIALGFGWIVHSFMVA